MNILLVRPPATYVKGSVKPSVSLPLGLLYIAAVLEKHGFPVEIFDAQVNESAPVFEHSDGNIHMGYGWDEIELEIRKRNPGIVGITCPFTTQRSNALRMAGIVKKVSRGFFTVVGGNDPTVRPLAYFPDGAPVDLVCMGEGENTMLGIALALREGRPGTGIPGTAWRDGAEVRVNKDRERIADLDELPFPAYHLVDMEKYFRMFGRGFTDRPVWTSSGSERAVSVITSRGCPFHCTFCSIHLHMGRRWRAHSAGYVLRHLEFLVSRYGIRHIHFEDDNLSADRKRFRTMLDGFLQMGCGFTWDTPNGVRVDTLTKEILSDCSKSGCAYLIFGVESGNQKVLNEIIGKKLDLGAVNQVFSWCRDLELDAMAFFVIGFPGETRREMRETVDFALRLQYKYDVNPGLFIATPLPGTRLETTMMEKGLLNRELTAEELSRITQGGIAIDGGTFAAADVLATRAVFLKACRRNILRNLSAFLLKHPFAAPILLRAFIEARKRQSAGEALLGVCLHKNFLARRGRRENAIRKSRRRP